MKLCACGSGTEQQQGQCADQEEGQDTATVPVLGTQFNVLHCGYFGKLLVLLLVYNKSKRRTFECAHSSWIVNRFRIQEVIEYDCHLA